MGAAPSCVCQTMGGFSAAAILVLPWQEMAGTVKVRNRTLTFITAHTNATVTVV